MTLQPGCHFAVAARFHLAADWPRRLRVGAGVEQADGVFVPRGPWRPPDDDELESLVLRADAPLEELADCVRLLAIPKHLLSAWWDLLDDGAGEEGSLPGFDGFVGQLAEFFAFKDLPMPEGARCEVIVTRPGQRSVRREGRACNPWGGINLGDEPTSLVLVNGCPDYPPVRVIFGPGEGWRVPEGGLLLDGCTEDKQEADVLLLISAPV